MTPYEQTLAFWEKKQIADDAALSAALNERSVAFAFHSGKLENDAVTYHDTREIFEHDGVTAYTGDLRTLFELKNAKEAYAFFLAAFGERRPLDEALVLETQRLLTQNTYDTRRWRLGERPGTYKIHDYVTGREEVGAPPEDVKAEMDELLEDVRELQDLPVEKVLTAAAFFHAKLENIHPFADGNGRTGRLLLNYLLVLHGHPPVIVHEEDRKAYYAALEAWDTAQDLAPLRTFLIEQTVKTWEKQLAREKKNQKGD